MVTCSQEAFDALNIEEPGKAYSEEDYQKEIKMGRYDSLEAAIEGMERHAQITQQIMRKESIQDIAGTMNMILNHSMILDMVCLIRHLSTVV